MHASCQDCLRRLRERRAATAAEAEEALQRELEEQAALAAQLDDGVQHDEIDPYDEFFGHGDDLMDVDVLEESALSNEEARRVKSFRDALDNIALDTCSCCQESDWDLKIVEGVCKSCRADKEATKKFSSANKVNPTFTQPACLKGLTDVEEMIISRVLPLMQVRHTRG
ncbi:hypothetical protein PENSPDRAFT_575770, partial [Peniophora sp. CONT]